MKIQNKDIIKNEYLLIQIILYDEKINNLQNKVEECNIMNKYVSFSILSSIYSFSLGKICWC